MTFSKKTLLLCLCQCLLCFIVKGQDKISQKRMDGKTSEQIIQEYAYWSEVKNDWANLAHYQDANARLKNRSETKNRVVFMGNSITERWSVHSPEFFKEPTRINRGIGGQTTPQMLLRFRQDVIELNPKVVVLLAGTNDIAGNTGPATNDMVLNNIFSMVELAEANNIKVILCSVLPVNKYPWSPELQPAQRVISLNKSLKLYAKKKMISYVDYFSSMADDKNGLPVKYAADGVHPNKEGYKIMESLLKEKIKFLLNTHN